jgi:hypothetical protein
MSKPSRKSPPASPPPVQPNRSKTPILIIAATVLALGVGAYTLLRPEPVTSAPQPEAAPAAAAEAAPPIGPVAPAPAVALAPHTQKQYPALDLPAYPLGRSPEVITAAYMFAAEHPEVLTYVPCFCGCERGGHRGNEDCFVKSRAANGDVSEWEPHGMECNVCVDVATQAKQMFSSGASIREIRNAVEQKWASQAAQNHSHTPTPDPPK